MKFFVIIGISIIVSGSIVLFYFAQNEIRESSNEIELTLDNYDFFYPEELRLRWTNEKIIQQSDVIVLADLEKYENNQWVLGSNHLDIKGYTQGDEIKIDSVFSSFFPLAGSEKPIVNESYVWFLKKDGEKYGLVSEEGIVEGKYFQSIKQVVIEPTVLTKIENKKIMLDDYDIPKTNDGLIDYHKLIEIVSKPIFVELFEDIGISVKENDVVLMRGAWILMYAEYSNMCGYALVDDEVYWLESDLARDKITKASIMSENPDPCKPNYGSCFCFAQYDMVEKTTSKLTYFDEDSEESIGKIFQGFLNEGGKVVNMPKRFVIGNHNFAMQPDEVTICGAFVNENKNPPLEMAINANLTAHRYFEGVIRDGQVVGWGLSDPMRLCAINTDAKVFEFN